MNKMTFRKYVVFQESVRCILAMLVVCFSSCKSDIVEKQQHWGLYPALTNSFYKTYVYLNNRGELAFDEAISSRSLFCDGLAKVGSKFIDEQGNTAFDYSVCGFSACSDFSEGIAWALRGVDYSTAIAIDKQGNILFEVGGVPVTLYKDGIAGVKKNQNSSEIAFFDKKGKMVVQPRKDFAGDKYFHNGKISIVSYEQYSMGAYGAVDMEGKQVVDYISKKPLYFDSNDCAVVQSLENDLYGLIDNKGHYLIEPQFAYLRSDGGLYQFCESKEDMKAGWCDKRGKIVIKPIAKLDYADMEYGGQLFYGDKWAFVKTDEGNAFIDKKGNIVLRTEFEAYSPYINDVALVKKGFRYNFIDRAGNIVNENEFVFAYDHEYMIGTMVASDNPMGQIAWGR